MRRATMVCALLLAGLTYPAIAQRAQTSSRAALQGADVQARTAPPRPADLVVSAAATPRSIQVFVVPVPGGLLTNRPVNYVVVPAEGATIIPPLSGVIAPGEADPRSVMVAASVPAGALAGPQTIAAVRFSQGDRTVPVPLELRVSHTHSATIRLAQQLFGGRPGDRIVVHYVLTNTGNGPDTLDVTAAPPVHWAMAGSPRRYALRLGESVSGEVTVTIPRAAEAGVFQVTVAVSAGRDRLAATDAVIELFATPGVRSTIGPKLVAGVASVLDDSGRAMPVIGLDLTGALTDRVQVFGRLIQATDPANADQRGLARVGYFVGAPYLTVAGPAWQVTGGTTGRSFSDVTGVSAYGQGASATWAGAGWSAATLLAAPLSVALPGDSDRHLLGLRVGRRVWRSGGEINATLTDLRDPFVTHRLLEAAGVGATSPVFAGVTASGEVAHRWFAGGRGLGWVTELKRQGREDFGQVRLVHAPGGSAAFAHAQDELSVNASRMFGRRLSVGAGYWTSDDDNQTFSRLHTTGWSFTPRFDLTGRTTLVVEVHSNSFDATSPAGLLGNGETTVRLGVNTQHGTMFLSGGAALGIVRQSAGLPGGPNIETTANRQSVRIGAGTATDRGTLELSGSFDHSDAGVGLLPNALVVGVKAQGVALAASAQSPVLNAELQYYGWFGDRAPVAVARLGLLAPLPGNLALTLDIERNPFITGLLGGAQWVPVLKITRSMRLAVGALRPAVKGEVFQDLNGNGVRDRGESGTAGVVIRRGSESVITDGSGRFRFYSKSDAPVRLDETSLPVGVIANPAARPDRQPQDAIVIGVIPTARVDIRLVPTADSSGRMPRVDLNGIMIQAFDSAGNAWTARVDGDGLARFYALPPGRYRVEVEVTGLREPVRLGPAPVFTVTPNQPVPVQTIRVYPRPIRMFDPSGLGLRPADSRPVRAPGE